MRKKITTNKKHIHLNLKAKWFDMILCGKKTQEYRDLSDYWNNRFDEFFPNHSIVEGNCYNECKIESVIFSNGYRKDRRQMEVELYGIMISDGLTQWGAKVDTCYYTLLLGSVIQSNCELNNINH